MSRCSTRSTRWRVWELWADIEREFGVKISDTHVPHFSYHVATTYAPTAARGACQRSRRQRAGAHGLVLRLGVINAPPPLFFLPLARTDALSALHRRLWTELEPIATNVIGPLRGAGLVRDGQPGA